MQITTTHLKTWFNELNKRYFNDELPIPQLAVGNSRTRLGTMSCKVRRTPVSRKHYDHCIRLSNYYDISEDEFKNVFLHEMIHYYISVKGIKDTSAHGGVFRRMMKALNADGWHITIREKSKLPVSEHNIKRQQNNVVVAIETRTGAKLLSVVSPAYTKRIDTALSHSPEVASKAWFITTDESFNTWPKVRTPKARRVSEAEYKEKTSVMKPLKLHDA